MGAFVIQVYRGEWVTTSFSFDTWAEGNEYRNRYLPLSFGPTRIIRATEVEA